MKPICFVVETNGTEIEHSLPSRWEICGRCNGNGVHDHPAFSNGISSEDFAEDEDFRHDYMSGRYDVPCTECAGTGKTLVPDEQRADPVVLELYHTQQREEAQDRRADAYTRRMENGGY